MTSMISLIVVLLAAYAYSAPVVPDIQNATVSMEVENATSITEGEHVTVGFQAENVLILARREASVVADTKNGKLNVSLSSSESESNETTDHPSQRDIEDTFTTEINKREIDTEVTEPSAVSENERDVTEDTFTTEINKREIDTEVTEPSAATENERDVTEDSFTTEINKREIDTEVTEPSAVSENERSFTEDTFTSENTKRGIEVELTTAEESPVHVQNVKRSLDNQPWLASRVAKRSLDNQPWLAADSGAKVIKRSVQIVESSTDVDETSTGEDSSVPSTSEVNHMQREAENFPALTTEASEAFNRRAIGSVESVQADESSTVIVVKVQPESTTEEEPSSSSTVDYVETTEFSSTSDYETTVVPVEESSSASPIPSESTSKILAIIPGTISRTQYVVPPVHQVQLSQGENQTVVETKQPHY